MTDPANNRRHRRLPINLPVTLISARRELLLDTEDISFSGIYVRTDTPAPLRQLVKFRFMTPDTHQDLNMLAMCVYTVSVEQAERFNRAPGMALNLYGLDKDTRDVWTAFVARTLEAYDAAALNDLLRHMPVVSGHVEPLRRRFPRVVAEFAVRVHTVKALFEVMTQNLSLGGAFLNTDELLPIGAPVRLVIVHPEDGSEFEIKGRVLRAVETPKDRRGLGVRFDDLEGDSAASFHDFIESGLQVVDIDADLFVESDDLLLE